MNNQFSIFNSLNLIKKKKVIRIDYLYLDLKTCDRCVGTDEVLEAVIK